MSLSRSAAQHRTRGGCRPQGLGSRVWPRRGVASRQPTAAGSKAAWGLYGACSSALPSLSSLPPRLAGAKAAWGLHRRQIRARCAQAARLMAAATPSPHSARVAVVTGGNKGIGLEVCRQLASNGITVVLTARDEKRGAAAVEELADAGLSGVVFHQLEVTDAQSIARLAGFLKARFGKLDILVNNAAIGGVQSLPVENVSEKIKGMDAFQMAELMRKSCRETNDAAKAGVQTNYYGVKNVTEALLPLLLQASSSGGGRVVNVSSDFGLLRYLRNEEVKRELDDIEGLTEERLDELLSTFLRDFEAGALESRGWPTEFAAYKVAKAALNSYSRVLARRHPELRVNCAHPGYVKTDMTRQTGLLTPAQGAANVVKVALLPEGGPTGAFFALGKEAPFV